VQKLYQRLIEWARFSSRPSEPKVTRTVHSEVTVERQGIIVLIGGAVASGLDTCPLCGQKLAVSQTGSNGALVQASQKQALPEKIAQLTTKKT
jgi:hypothetical protein